MERKDSIERLKLLLQKIDDYENAKEALRKEEDSLNKVIHNYPSKLVAFDKKNKPGFIKGKIGSVPIKPHGAIKLVFPVYFAKKAKYEKAYAEYHKLLPLAEAAYRETFAEERNALIEQDKKEQQEAIKELRGNVEQKKEAFVIAQNTLELDDLLSEKIKTKDTVCTLIEYFEDHRADNIKEAVNLWYDEKRKDEEEARAEAHRQEMLALEEERVRAAQSAEEYARMQYEEARDAAEYARQAAANAQDMADAAQRAEWDRWYDSEED